MKTLFFTIANTPKHLADHIYGLNHTRHHRKIAGALVMCFGVGLAHAGSFVDITAIHLLAELVGFSFHGAGLTPWIEHENKN